MLHCVQAQHRDQRCQKHLCGAHEQRGVCRGVEDQSTKEVGDAEAKHVCCFAQDSNNSVQLENCWHASLTLLMSLLLMPLLVATHGCALMQAPGRPG